MTVDKHHPVKRMIEQKRRQILVHSYIYYELNDSIISDGRWYEIADELVALQDAFPEIAKQCVFHDEFKDFDRSTGFHLYHRNHETKEYCKRQAEYLLKMHKVEAYQWRDQ